MSLSNFVFPGVGTKLLVLGHQKSGTTAIGALLSHLCDFSYSNDPFYNVDRGEAKLVKRVLDGDVSLRKVSLFRSKLFGREVVKDPDLIFVDRVELDRTFPNAQKLFVVRNPYDNIRSLLNRLRLSGTIDNSNIGAGQMYKGNRHWELVIGGHLPRIDATSIVEVLAKRWALAVDACSDYGIESIRYEDFVADKLSTIRALASSLGFEERNSIEPLLDVQFQPKGQCVEDYFRFFGADNLGLINQVCRSRMEDFGYELHHPS